MGKLLLSAALRHTAVPPDLWGLHASELGCDFCAAGPLAGALLTTLQPAAPLARVAAGRTQAAAASEQQLAL